MTARMNPARILLVSNVRPLRVWKIARRVTHEIPGVEICGIVQRPMQKLPLAQQRIADGATRAKHWFYSLVEEFMHWVLWWTHGAPRNLNGARKFTVERLAEKCGQAGSPFLLAENIGDAKVLEFIRQQNAELLIVLGDIPLSSELLSIPSRGAIRAYYDEHNHNGTKVGESLQIEIEHFTRGSKTAFTIAHLKMPLQPYDGLAGITLKSDLIADDLLLQTAIGLQTASQVKTSKVVMEWIQRIYSPYLTQLEPVPTQTAQAKLSRQRFRSEWKLSVETLLFSPFASARNWYRRWRGHYPVLVLAHHLVSDRPHRMGISTENFWQAVSFLRRHYRIVSLAEAVELLRSGNVKVPTVVLTFDDGYADNFVNLRAVADEAEIPVALFITTQPVEIQCEFQHDLAHGIKGALPLTWDQIQYWGSQGAEFGSHTRTHLDCGSADRTKLEWEIVGSKHDLEGHLGKPVGFFAFPFGNPDNISSDAANMASSVYSHVASCSGGENLPDKAGNHRYLVRKNLYSDLWELELELQSVLDWVESIKRRFRFKRVEPAISSGRATATSALSTYANR